LTENRPATTVVTGPNTTMTEITIIEEEANTVHAHPDAARSTFLVDNGCLPATVGWELGPNGLCQG
jgi:hypothetical protein